MLSGAALLRAGFRDAAGKIRTTGTVQLSGARTAFLLPLPDAKQAKYPLQLAYLELENPGQAPASAALYAVRSMQQQNRLAAVDFFIGTDTGIGVLRKGHEQALTFQFINRSAQQGEYTAEVNLRHYSGRTLQEYFDLVLPSGERVSVEPKRKPDLWGHWDASVVLREKSNPKESVKKETAFAYLDPAGPTSGRSPGFLFSICTHTERWSPGEQRKEIEAVALCGAKVARVGTPWSGLQPAPGQWNWEKLDELVALYGAAGVEIQYILGYPPNWAAKPETRHLAWNVWNRSAPEDGIWRQYVETMVKRYRGKIFYWENWNEPDLLGKRMSTAEYVRLQKSAFEVIRKTAPEAVVMTGGFATVADHAVRKDNPHFYSDFFTGANGCFDLHAHHEHGSFANFAERIDGIFLPMRQKYRVTVPWYANETAVASMDGSVRMQAETLFKKLTFAWARGAVGYTWYDLRNDGFLRGDAEHNYGMMTNDFVPKPVYSVFNMLAGTLRNARFVRQWKCGGPLWVFEFQDGGKRFVAAWDESVSSASHPLLLHSSGTAVTKIDLMGNRVPVMLCDNCAVLDAGAEPALWEVCGAKDLQIAGELIECVSGGIAVQGIPYPVKAVIRNPWREEVRFDLAMGKTGRHIKIAPGGEAAVEFTPVPAKEPLMLHWKNSLGMTGTIIIPVESAQLIPAGEFSRRAPDFVLDRRKDVVSLVEAYPGTAHRIWKNAQDLSVRGWTGLQHEEVQFRFEVTDDVHHQPYSGPEVWKGDNIQLAIAIPGQNGYWELGLSRLNSGKSEVAVFSVPSGAQAGEVRKLARLETSRKGDVTVYQLAVPLAALKTTAAKWQSGVRLNFIVNENDGEGRDGWIQFAPGIGKSKDPSQFPLLLFRK